MALIRALGLQFAFLPQTMRPELCLQMRFVCTRIMERQMRVWAQPSSQSVGRLGDNDTMWIIIGRLNAL